MAVAIVAGLAYPIISIKTWFDYLNPQRRLGRAGRPCAARDRSLRARSRQPDLRTGKSEADVAAIRWLNDHAKPGDIVLEAPGCGYTINSELPTSRFSTFTGIPTVIGWNGHETQWRGGQPELLNQIVPRAGDVSSMYGDPDPATNPLFDQYGITLMVVGDLESTARVSRAAVNRTARLPGRSSRSMSPATRGLAGSSSTTARRRSTAESSDLRMRV